jgi:hypothetical protein
LTERYRIQIDGIDREHHEELARVAALRAMPLRGYRSSVGAREAIAELLPFCHLPLRLLARLDTCE